MLLILLTTFQIKVCKSIFLIHHCYEKYELIVNFVFKQLHFACISFSNILLMIFCSIQLMHIGPLIIYFYLLFTFFQMFLCVFSLYKDLFIVFFNVWLSKFITDYSLYNLYFNLFKCFINQSSLRVLFYDS